MIKELQKAQEKLRIIDKLSNYMQKVDNVTTLEIAYFIHTLVEVDSITLDMYRSVTSFGLQANKDMFVSVTEFEI